MAKIARTQQNAGDVLAPEILDVSLSYLEALNCPRALTVAILLRHHEYVQVAQLKAKPSAYLFWWEYHLAACASDWLRKYPDLPVKRQGWDSEEATITAWFQSEEQCRLTNARLEASSAIDDLFLDSAAEFVREILGPLPNDLTPKFGPGSTASDKASACSVLDKLVSRPTVTSEAMLLYPLWEGTAWERSHLTDTGEKKATYDAEIVKGNTFFMVNKTALIKRGCSKGPSINLAYQLSVGLHLRERLRTAAGLDIVTGQKRHQNLAQRGSVDGSYATIDSERASDTLSKGLVGRLLAKSPWWLMLLEVLREPYTKVGDDWIKLEKFSAMGNGFTFELETLIFLALCVSAIDWMGGSPSHPGKGARQLIREGHVSVFGDDIVVPGDVAHAVTDALKLGGFTVNLQKSYLDGEFRESCGGDYFRGIPVMTPKLEDVMCEPHHWISIHNLVKARVSDVHGKSQILRFIKALLPRQYRSIYGPTYLGDQVLHGWYGDAITKKGGTKGRRYTSEDGLQREDPNQWVATIKVVKPVLSQIRFDPYNHAAQLAYFLYVRRSEPPTRRPINKRRIKGEITRYTDDYHVMVYDKVPKPPDFLVRTPWSSHFGIRDGDYVG